MAKKTWNLSVDKNIVRLLSASTYEDFPGALREVVSNAYDADATEVKIRINIEKDLIEFIDDGIGMTPDEFDFFLRIAGQKSTTQISPEFGRTKIGQFGIGFLSVFPFGRKISIKSSAIRSALEFEAQIPADKYINPRSRTVDVQDIAIPGTLSEDQGNIGKHGTTILITGLTDIAKSYFDYQKRVSKTSTSIRSKVPFEQLKWNLEENLPLDYREESPYRQSFEDLAPVGMNVFLNGERLFRNDPGRQILESNNWSHNGINCRYVIATGWKSIVPEENRHLKVRLLNVGIGSRTAFDLGRLGRTFSRLHWLAGEVRILSGMNHLLSIDRSRFIDSQEYDAFREYFRGRLSHYAYYVEDVAVAERDIKRQLSNSRAAKVGSRKEMISEKHYCFFCC